MPPLVPENLGTDSVEPLPPPAWEDMAFKSALFLYDKFEGGAGYAEKIFERITETLELCRRMIRECTCENGCPACVPPLPPGVNDEELGIPFALVANRISSELLHRLHDHLDAGYTVSPHLISHFVGYA